MVADYCRISLLDVEELPFWQFLVYRRDAFIYRMEQTEEGQDYLYNAWLLEQTKPSTVPEWVKQ